MGVCSDKDIPGKHLNIYKNNKIHYLLVTSENRWYENNKNELVVLFTQTAHSQHAI